MGGGATGITRIDGKTGEYSFFRKAGLSPANLSNIFVISIVEDRFGYMWFGTYGGLNRYDPRTGRFAAFRHSPADPHSLSHDIVYSLMVDHQGTLWAGTEDGLNRLEDPATAGSACGRVPRRAPHRRMSVRWLRTLTASCGWSAGLFNASNRRPGVSLLTASIPSERERPVATPPLTR